MVTENYFMKKYYYMAFLYTGETHTHTGGEDGGKEKDTEKEKNISTAVSLYRSFLLTSKALVCNMN